MKFQSIFLLALSATATLAQQKNWPTPTHGDFTISNFTFDSGQVLNNLKIHYQTLGKLQVHPDGTTNAVLILHGTTGSSGQFLNPDFAGVLFNPGQVLDTKKYFIIMPDGIGHGNSSKPSTSGLRASFPGYQYSDMTRATYRLLTEHLRVKHTRLVMGVSMGGMHTWTMGTQYPSLSDALMPIACLPTQISGQNRLWRKFIIELIRSDPAWNSGDYTAQPIASLGGALFLVQTMFSSPLYYQSQYPTRDAMDRYVDQLLPHIAEYDANDLLYAWNASHTYDPTEEGLGKIKARGLTAVNTADDMINPPELGVLERVVGSLELRGLGAKAVVVPESSETVGHGSYIKAKLWVDELQLLLAKTGPKGSSSCS
ncbi:Alpha/Beta hydrolase protein [Podospora didyma]|uniref:Alpha/Beta hydrolase protein n=1 Tax=Podospora didyma TaxID=330526 RepID=A0AAE0NXX3_9PEZI|nr:Alpha/Beta hydrolase protein [Podospora didyma]